MLNVFDPAGKFAPSHFFKRVTEAETLEVFEKVVRVTVVTAYSITLPPVSKAVGRAYSFFVETNGTPADLTIQDQDESEEWFDKVLSAASEELVLWSDGYKWHTLNAGVTENNYTLHTDSYTITENDFGKTHAIATDAKVFTLPKAAAINKGKEITFLNIGASTNNILTIASDALDYIVGSITLAGSVVSKSVTVDKDLINTKGTSVVGDTVTLVSNGSSGYYIKTATGIWASE